MNIFILTLFPDMFSGIFDSSIIKRAQKQNLVKIIFVNLRDFASDKYKTVDDRPYGGGVGMIMKIDIIDKALTFVKNKISSVKKNLIILLDPKGEIYNQKIADRFSKYDNLILICGHYEGIDARVDKLIDIKISIGKYILTGGEIPSMAIVDSVVRLLPNVLKKHTAILNESFSQKNNLEPPQYTRPEIYKKLKVPKILLSGNHAKISIWKKKNTHYS
jgi:tRNA (guanine37-N1)-methyltransferase